ncbi:hypothetical protein CLAFUW4_11094 [Fulvia fulva]|uniref:Uncharacterized protein n=1 Tax=Passalora fulva TaxID=5499 RepID=A0A9Q8URD9_PASFU|nr:uncharacterized protein CLAFUR5_10137 [Fulvia fulva]KAK4619687.1 hypothetical protein CLAFUR4_11099 [Fulvia fulva]KAK4620326.1 hypothetical protein CLAFUR0_11105 [Fulvia fulva]UJO19630.1 hypothetical protein CLAFUR5_10137 [Fulvia fulva]WPV17171.1 hypothetical protein CLAFUW4_11094 [Fulvia fulva]WPV32485.1 hypothetical protein CLAFUW7_11091 [Fulvia fulva]
MPPSTERPEYWPLPFVVRFNHENGIAPYNGAVAITANSKAVTPEQASRSPAISKAFAGCQAVAKLLKVTAPIRIDVPQRADEAESPFVLFDVNMKPNMTAPGRPGRDDQASLTALAAAEGGYNSAELLRMILGSARKLEELRGTDLPRWSEQ